MQAAIIPKSKEISIISRFSFLEKRGEINPAANQATAEFVKKSDTALSWDLFIASWI